MPHTPENDGPVVNNQRRLSFCLPATVAVVTSSWTPGRAYKSQLRVPYPSLSDTASCPSTVVIAFPFQPPLCTSAESSASPMAHTLVLIDSGLGELGNHGTVAGRTIYFQRLLPSSISDLGSITYQFAVVVPCTNTPQGHPGGVASRQPCRSATRRNGTVAAHLQPMVAFGVLSGGFPTKSKARSPACSLDSQQESMKPVTLQTPSRKTDGR